MGHVAASRSLLQFVQSKDIGNHGCGWGYLADYLPDTTLMLWIASESPISKTKRAALTNWKLLGLEVLKCH
jgi:hypothetical protein